MDSVVTNSVVQVPEIVAVSVTLVDAVSGRIIKKLVHEWATLPVHCLIIENFVITTYWNSKVS